MRREISEKIILPEGVEAEISNGKIKIRKAGNEASRKYAGFEAKKEDNSIILISQRATKKEKKEIKTLAAHLRNILAGLNEKFIYKLQICAVHFPMNVSVDKAKSELVVKNFLGGVKPRIAKIVHGVEVKIEKEIIEVTGHDKENTGQTAANIEKATKVRNRDRRTFQDGIFITAKPGEKIL